MSLMIQAYLLERYGPRLNVEQLAEALQIGKSTIHNQIGAGTFPICTYLDQRTRFADVRDVASYLDSCRARATTPA
jgi:predicted DNA-binding transcriptional regulator AlpA